MARTKSRVYNSGDDKPHRSDDDDSDEAGGQQGNDSNDEGQQRGRRGRGEDDDASSGHDPSEEDDPNDIDDPSEEDDPNDSDRGQHDVVTEQKRIRQFGCESPGARESAQAFLEHQLQGATLQKFPYVAGQLVDLLAEPIDVSARDWPTTASAIRRLAERHRNRGAVRIDAPQELIEVAMTADFWCRMLGFLYEQGTARNAAAGPLIVHEPDKMLDCRPDGHPAYFFKESHGDEEFCVEIQVLEFQWQNHAAMTTGTYAMLSPRIYQRLPVTHVTRLDGRRAFRVALVPAKDESESEGSDGEFDEYSDSWTVGYETCNERRGWALEQVRGWYAKDAEHPHTMWCNTTQGDRRFRRLSGPRRPGYSITSDPFIAAILVPSDPLQTGLTLYRSVLRSVRPIRETVRRGDFHIEIDSRSVSELASQALSLIAADIEGKPADIWSAPQAVRDLCMAVFCTVEDCFWAANFDIDYSKCMLERWTSTIPQMKDGTVGGSYFFPFRCTNGIMTETSVSMSGDQLLVNVKFNASTVAFGPDRETECPAECILYVQMLGSEGCSSVRAALKSVLTCEVEDVVLEAHPPNEWLVQQALYGRNADPFHPDRLGSVLTSLLAAAYPDGSADLNVEWKADIPDRNILAGTRRTISFLIREKTSQSAVEVVFERDLTQERKVSARQVVNSNTVKLRVTVRRFNAWSVWPKSMKDHLALKLLAGYLDKHGLSSNSAENLLDTFSNGGSVQLSAWKVWQRSFCFWKLEWLDKHILDLLQYLSLIAGAGMPTKCAFTADPIQSLGLPAFAVLALGFPCRVAWVGTVEWPESKATVECVMQRESYEEPISGAGRYAFTLQVNVRVSSMHPNSIGPNQAAKVMVSTPQAGIAGSQAKVGNIAPKRWLEG